MYTGHYNANYQFVINHRTRRSAGPYTGQAPLLTASKIQHCNIIANEKEKSTAGAIVLKTEPSHVIRATFSPALNKALTPKVPTPSTDIVVVPTPYTETVVVPLATVKSEIRYPVERNARLKCNPSPSPAAVAKSVRKVSGGCKQRRANLPPGAFAGWPDQTLDVALVLSSIKDRGVKGRRTRKPCYASQFPAKNVIDLWPEHQTRAKTRIKTWQDNGVTQLVKQVRRGKKRPRSMSSNPLPFNPEDRGTNFKCDECGIRFDTKRRQYLHRYTVHPKQLSPVPCGKTFKQKSHGTRHAMNCRICKMITAQMNAAKAFPGSTVSPNGLHENNTNVIKAMNMLPPSVL